MLTTTRKMKYRVIRSSSTFVLLGMPSKAASSANEVSRNSAGRNFGRPSQDRWEQ
jgi:hypothetical protein